jgi:pimeloyl-ACP methyl ester carboxylesterase
VSGHERDVASHQRLPGGSHQNDQRWNPQAQVKIYPDAAHGFLFQHHAEFARDVDAFLRE